MISEAILEKMISKNAFSAKFIRHTFNKNYKIKEKLKSIE